MGHLAGAYIAAMLAVDPRWRGETRSVARGFVGLAEPYDFAQFDVDASRAAFGQVSDPAETQPVTWAGTGDPPRSCYTGLRIPSCVPETAKRWPTGCARAALL